MERICTITDVFNALDDSVNLIMDLKNKNVKSLDTLEEMIRNVRHIQLMIDKEQVKNDRAVTKYENCIQEAKDFLGVI